jgi:Flp pilus assembly pilin Flp
MTSINTPGTANLSTRWSFSTFIARLRRDEAGLSTVEYVILLALVAVVSIGTWQAFGERIETAITDATTALDAVL